MSTHGFNFILGAQSCCALPANAVPVPAPVVARRKGSPRPPGAEEPVFGEAGLPAGHSAALQFLFAFVVALFLSSTAPAFAQRATLADGLKAAVLRADETRLYAMLADDIAALDDILAPDCLYVHSNGNAQTKAQLLGALKSGAFKYTALRYTAPPQVRLYGTGTAVLTGTMQIEVQLPDGKTVKPTLVVTAIYVVLNDRWQLASYQSTNAPAK